MQKQGVRLKMALDQYSFSSPLHGVVHAEVEYDWDEATQTGTTRISRVTVDNRQGLSGARFQVYIPPSATTPTFNQAFRPGQQTTINVPGGQTYRVDNARMVFGWDVSVI